jgi:nitrate/TMAO reductase-like tetraheme cytochrome c subunit
MGTEEEAYVMGSSRGRRLPMVFVLLAVVVAMVAVAIGLALGGGARAVAAPAATDATIEATSFSVTDDHTEKFAVCPGNERALGGGVVQSGPSTGFVLQVSGPLNSSGVTAQTVSGSIPKQWYAAVSNGSEYTRDFKVFAICSARSKATIVATSFSVADNQTGEGFAVCPGNKRALGGGVVQSGDPMHLGMRASGPLNSSGVTAKTVSGSIPKQWYAAVSNGSGKARDFKVFAICSARSKATIEATSFSVANDQIGEEFAKCPGNKRALGGGVVQSGPAQGVGVRASGPLNSSGVTAQTQSGDIPKQWYAAVYNNSGKAQDFKVFAVCE